MKYFKYDKEVKIDKGWKEIWGESLQKNDSGKNFRCNRKAVKVKQDSIFILFSIQ